MTASADAPGAPPRRRRGRPVAVAAAVAVAAGAVALGLNRARPGEAAGPTTATTRPAGTATVVRTDLVERFTADGTLGHGDTRTVASPRPGVVTRLPEVGATVERGRAVAHVDEKPVPLLLGTLPAYRNLSVDSTDGDDVRQMEENLVALGHAAATAGEAETAGRLTVDNHFDWATRAAVRRWQQALGAEQTGAVAPTDYVVSATPLRVAERTASIGDDARPGLPLVKASGTDRTVTVKLDVARQSLVHAGDPVQVELPDHRVVAAHVTALSTVAEVDVDQSGRATGKAKIPVAIALDDPAAAGSLDQAPVSVRVVEHQATGVLAVPVKALLALQEGGYAVEVGPAGARRYVPVTVGTFAGGLVEITGAVDVGDTVVVAQ